MGKWNSTFSSCQLREEDPRKRICFSNVSIDFGLLEIANLSWLASLLRFSSHRINRLRLLLICERYLRLYATLLICEPAISDILL